MENINDDLNPSKIAKIDEKSKDISTICIDKNINIDTNVIFKSLSSSLSSSSSSSNDDSDMIKIDGSIGEGGGQVLRSSVALSSITGKPLTIFNIRHNRPKPGLSHQHKVCIDAAAEICNANLTGVELKSTRITFIPQKSLNIRKSNYIFDIVTAGSTSLVLQTILPILLFSTSTSTVVIKGGTHNSMSPPYEFIKYCYLPQLYKMGINVEIELVKYGFFPKGGGEIKLIIQPWIDKIPLNLLSLGNVISSKVYYFYSKIKSFNFNTNIILEKIDISNLSNAQGQYIQSRIDYENITDIETIFIEKKDRLDKLKLDFNKLNKGPNSVGEYLSDQLLLPMVLGNGGTYSINNKSSHFTTNIEIINNFFPNRITVEDNIVVVSKSL
jgi:RNA 3'-terminal phosphate cyclase (ATP)